MRKASWPAWICIVHEGQRPAASRAIAVSSMSDPDWEAAFVDFERAIALFGEIEARPDEARAIHAYAMALDAAGRPEGVDKLAEAARQFEDLGMTAEPSTS